MQWSSALAKEAVTMRKVFVLPPMDSLRRCVSLESRYGMWVRVLEVRA